MGECECGPIKPGTRIRDLGDHVVGMIQSWKDREVDVRKCCSRFGKRFPRSDSTVLMRLNCPPAFDSLFVVKMHGERHAPQAHTEAEGAAMHHARRRFGEAAPGRHPVPEVYRIDAAADIIVMEYVNGRRYVHARAGRWSQAQRRRFVRQMAVIRLTLMGKTASYIGAPALSSDGRLELERMVGGVYHSGGRGEYYDEIKFLLGPYKTVKDYALSTLTKEIVFYNAWLEEDTKPKPPPPGDRFASWWDWIEYLTRLAKYCETRTFRTEEPIVFSHLQPASGEHLVMRGSKVVGLLDWQKSWYMPYSEAVGGALDFPTADREFDPREWAEEDVKPFSRQPDPISETFSQRLQRYRDAGAESEPRPNWEVINEYGGPLCEDDFAADFPSDDEGDDAHVGYEDGVSKYAESDDGDRSMHDGDEDEDTGDRERMEETWYLRPVWKLMHEYIMRGGGGTLSFKEEAFKDPLAHWPDGLVTTLTRNVMAPDMKPIYHIPRS